MALPDVDNGYRNSDSLIIKDVFPDLGAVRKGLFPSAIERRVAINDYERALELQGRLTPAVSDSVNKALDVRGRTRAVIYIAGPLTGMDERTKKRYGEVSDYLSSHGQTIDGKDKFLVMCLTYTEQIQSNIPV